MDGLREILAVLLRIPVCRLVYWACGAAVELEALLSEARPDGLDVLMRLFGGLAQQEPCGCEGPVDLIYPSPGKCAINKPGEPPSIFTADGTVMRIRWGYRQTDGSLGRDPDPTKGQADRVPEDREGPVPVSGETVMGVEVAEDRTLKPG
ncbi:MAG: hypothetical protein ACREU8_11745 [Gammaproteobacteria bacterium]